MKPDILHAVLVYRCSRCGTHAEYWQDAAHCGECRHVMTLDPAVWIGAHYDEVAK